MNDEKLSLAAIEKGLQDEQANIEREKQANQPHTSRPHKPLTEHQIEMCKKYGPLSAQFLGTFTMSNGESWKLHDMKIDAENETTTEVKNKNDVVIGVKQDPHLAELKVIQKAREDVRREKERQRTAKRRAEGKLR